MEQLEERRLLAINVLQTNLVSDLPGVAAVQDPNLVNPWGIAESSGSPFWISDNNSGQSTLYSVPGANNTPVSIDGLVVSIPTPVDPLGTSGTPTGTVFNIDGGKAGGFTVSGVDKNNNPITAPAIFLFDTEDGTIVGWNPAVNPKGFDPAKAGTYAVIARDNSGNNFTEPDPNKQTGAVYKGLTIATSATPIFSGDAASTGVLYASNFRAGRVEVYDSAFNPVTLPKSAFSDPNLPKGYAPFDVQVLNGKVYVTYALQNAAKHDDVAGEGHGFVDVFNLDGSPGLPDGKDMRLISRGPLDSPWGLAIAPPSFGTTAGALLVGNFGNGKIHAFDPNFPDTPIGGHEGTLLDPDGEPIQISGLWALKVGNGGAGGNANTVYFTAGLADETHGLFGSLAPVAPGTPEGPAEGQVVTAAVDVFQLDLQQLQSDLASGAPASTLAADVQAVQGALSDLVHAEITFVRDLHQDGHGGGKFALAPGAAHGHHRHARDAFFATQGHHHKHAAPADGLLGL